MNLVLSDEQRLIRDGANQLFRERGGPARLRALRDGKGASDVWGEIAALGWVGMTVPERWGGAGLGLAELTLVAEAAGRALAPEPLLGAVMASDAILLAGDDAQRQRWLAAVASGELVAALAWDEPPGSATRAEPAADGADGFVLNGHKRDVIAGASAALLIVAAGDELFALDARAPGVTLTPQRRIDSLPVARVTLAGVRVAAADRLAVPGVLGALLDRARVVTAAELLGVAGASLDMTLAYLRERQQFGVAIGTFQVLRHRAARMYIALELARSAVMAAARALDAQAGDPAALSQTVSLAKARANDAALLIADESIQMHGGIGMTDEHDIGLYYKRARVLATTLGDSAWHRDRWARLGGY